MMVEIAIVNVVVTATVDQRVDLRELGKFREVTYNSQKYRGQVAYLKFSKIRGKVSLFGSGKMISVGTKSERAATQDLEIVKNFLIDKGLIKPTILKPKTRNIVAMIDFRESVNLEELAMRCKTMYEPEQFPSCILKITDPYNATALVFSSGKTIVAGLTSSIHIEPVMQKIADIIEKSTN